LRSYLFLSWSKNSLPLMDPEGSLPCSQETVAYPYHKPYLSSLCPLFLFKTQRNTLRCAHKFSKWYITLSGFPTKSLHALFLSPVRATCSAHFILLCFVTLMVSYVEKRSSSPSLYSLLHSLLQFPS
jgi:hypothetical protein